MDAAKAVRRENFKIVGLSQEIRKNSNKQPNLILKGIKRTTKAQSYQKEGNKKHQRRNNLRKDQ